MLCENPKRERHDIPDGGRKIELNAVVNWGDDDQRDDHAKTRRFCSFACLADWAAERAAQHDGRVLAK